MTMRQDHVILYCTRAECRMGYAVVEADVPPICPACGKETRWTTTPPHGDIPRIAYVLSTNDRAFMKALGILAEQDDG